MRADDLSWLRFGVSYWWFKACLTLSHPAMPAPPLQPVMRHRLNLEGVYYCKELPLSLERQLERLRKR